MKICLLTPLFHPWNAGGAENYVNTLAQDLDKHHEVIVVTNKGPKAREQNKSNTNPRVIEINPINIDSLYSVIQKRSFIWTIKKSLWFILSMWNISTYVQIKRILDVEKPDLIHTNGLKGFSAFLFSFGKQLQVPQIHTVHDYELISPWVTLFRRGKPISRFNILDRIYMGFMRKISGNLDVVISPSQFVMDLHTKLGFFKNSKHIVVPHGMTLDCNAIPKQNATGEFLFVGRIIKEKGPQIAVKAFKKIKNKNVRLHIVGKGPYLESVKQIADGDQRIIFHGFVQNADLKQIFKRCSYLIFPSLWYETFGLVINELMNKGFPVIASNIGDIPELVIDGHNGFLFEPGDVDSLHHIMEDLINDNETLYKLSMNAIESSKKYALEEHTKSILEIYSSILSAQKNSLQ